MKNKILAFLTIIFFTVSPVYALTVTSAPGSGGGGSSGGTIVQEKIGAYGSSVTSTGTIPVDNTKPQNTEGTEVTGVQRIFTPTNSLNMLKIEVYMHVASSAAARSITLALFEDAVVDSIGATLGYVETADKTILLHLIVYKVAGGTSAITFKARVGANSAATITVNGEAGTQLFSTMLRSTMIITEYDITNFTTS